MPKPGTHRGLPSARRQSIIYHDSDAESEPLLDSDSDQPQDHVSIHHSTQWDRHVEPSLAMVQPQAWQDVTAFRQKFIRQILGPK